MTHTCRIECHHPNTWSAKQLPAVKDEAVKLASSPGNLLPFYSTSSLAKLSREHNLLLLSHKNIHLGIHGFRNAVPDPPGNVRTPGAIGAHETDLKPTFRLAEISSCSQGSGKISTCILTKYPDQLTLTPLHLVVAMAMDVYAPVPVVAV